MAESIPATICPACLVDKALHTDGWARVCAAQIMGPPRFWPDHHAESYQGRGPAWEKLQARLAQKSAGPCPKCCSDLMPTREGLLCPACGHLVDAELRVRPDGTVV